MLQADLEATGIPYAVEGPDGPLYADFHALRHSHIALLDRAGLTLKQAMQLARHSDPKLTMAVYRRAQLHDLVAAVEGISSLLPPAGRPGEAAALPGTDTDGVPPAWHASAVGNARRKACARLAPRIRPGEGC
jgi:hypothetical protein